MKLLKGFSLVVGLLLLVVAVSLAQRVSVTIHATDGVKSDSVIVGVDPLATNHIDPSLGEFELPPYPPTFDFRCVGKTGVDTLGLGVSRNYHKLVRNSQTDLYKLAFQSDETGGPVTFSWAHGLSGVGGGFWRLYEANGITELCDMTTQTSFTYSTFDVIPQFVIVRSGDAKGFLTANPDTLINAHNLKGKQFTAEKRKENGSEGDFTFVDTIVTQLVTGLHVEFSQGVVITNNGGFDKLTPDIKNQKWDFTWADTNAHKIHTSDAFTIHAIGNAGKQLTVKAWWWTKGGVGYPKKFKQPAMTPTGGGHLNLPMPNWWNVATDLYIAKGWLPTPPPPPSGIMIGETKTFTILKNGAPIPALRYVYHPKPMDLSKTLFDKVKGGQPVGTYACLDSFAGKPITKATKTLPPPKSKPNELLVQLLALRFNEGVSSYGGTGTGFGQLIYDAAPFAGLTVDSIGNLGDAFISCDAAVYNPFTGAQLLAAVKAINNEFTGKFDTTSWTTFVALKQARALGQSSILHRTSLAEFAPVGQFDKSFIETTPDRFSLKQNYPNPFNPSTTISFDLSKDAFVTLKIYNTLGQEVATILNHEQFSAGSGNEVTFDATNFASGVYFYQLIVNDGEFQQVKKMMLVK